MASLPRTGRIGVALRYWNDQSEFFGTKFQSTFGKVERNGHFVVG